MTNDIEKLKKEIRFLTHAVVYQGKKARVHYWKGAYAPESKLPKETITIYARDYGFGQLPNELNVSNDTDYQTDYFGKDIARVTPSSKYYKSVLKALQKAQVKNQKLMLKRKLKYGWVK